MTIALYLELYEMAIFIALQCLLMHCTNLLFIRILWHAIVASIQVV